MTNASKNTTQISSGNYSQKSFSAYQSQQKSIIKYSASTEDCHQISTHSIKSETSIGNKMYPTADPCAIYYGQIPQMTTKMGSPPHPEEQAIAGEMISAISLSTATTSK